MKKTALILIIINVLTRTSVFCATSQNETLPEESESEKELANEHENENITETTTFFSSSSSSSITTTTIKPLNLSLNSDFKPSSVVFTDFKPSLPLMPLPHASPKASSYEFNKKPVKPAHGEAKTFGIGGEPHFAVHAKIPQAPWLKVRHIFNTHGHEEHSREESKEHEESYKHRHSHEKDISERLNEERIQHNHQKNDVKIRFPTPTPTPPSSHHPYPYVNPMIKDTDKEYEEQHKGFTKKITSTGSTGLSSSSISGSGNDDFYGYRRHPDYSLSSYHSQFPSSPHSSSSSSSSSNFPPQIWQSNHNDEGDKSGYYYSEKSKYDGGISHEGIGHGFGGGISPWKKVIKFLTAIIPFGLLISALTPTVIDVSPIPNQTALNHGSSTTFRNLETRDQENIEPFDDQKFTNKKRRLNPKNDNKYFDILNILNKEECEERILCELLRNAGYSQNSQKHITSLLESFSGSESNDPKHRAELQRIFDAVQHNNCKKLTCRSIPDK